MLDLRKSDDVFVLVLDFKKSYLRYSCTHCSEQIGGQHMLNAPRKGGLDSFRTAYLRPALRLYIAVGWKLKKVPSICINKHCINGYARILTCLMMAWAFPSVSLSINTIDFHIQIYQKQIMNPKIKKQWAPWFKNTQQKNRYNSDSNNQFLGPFR